MRADSTASGALSFKAPTFAMAKTTSVLGNYVDRLKASGFPINDTIDVQECDANLQAPANSATNCDVFTEITGTTGPSGVVVFTTGVTMRVNGAYSDGAGGMCNVGGSCAIGVTDANHTAIGLQESVSFASPVVLIKKTANVLGNYVDSVKASGFPANDTIVAQECNPGVVFPTTVAANCDTANEVTGMAAANGKVNISPGITVAVGGAYSDQSGGMCPAGNGCEFVVYDQGNPSVGLGEAVTFASPTGTVAATANIQPNTLDKVTAGMFPNGDTVTAEECDNAVTPANVGTNCDVFTEISGTAGPSGKVAFNAVGVTVKVGAAYSDGAGGTVPAGGTADIVINDATHSGFFIAVPISLAG